MIVLSKPTPLSSPFAGYGAATPSLHLSSPPPFLYNDFEPRIEPQAGSSRRTARLRPRLRDMSALSIPGQSDSEDDDDDDEYVQLEEVRSISSPSRTRAQTRTPGKRSRSQSITGAEERGERLLACEHEGCGRLFLKPSKLREHALSHTGERPFRCTHPGCESSYVRSSHLQRHMNSHRDPLEKSFECLDCHKKFWSKEKLQRHAASHGSSGGKEEGESGEIKEGKGKRFECPHCSEIFHKHTKLRAHVTELHQDALIRESRSSTPKRVVKKKSIRSTSLKEQIDNDEDGESKADEDGSQIKEEEIRFRPFKCEVEGCEWSFETSQRLRVHQKVHQGKRYICSHQSHIETFPSFSKWSDLQNHLKIEHPPVCPYGACSGRVFKSKKNLNEHIKVHVDRGDMMDEPQEQANPQVSSPATGDSDDYTPEVESRERRGRKRAREEENDDRAEKRLKRTDSDVGKDWMCNEPECDKKFKTKRALTVHHSTAHLGLRPFACPHEQCDNTYGHKHLLQRHIAARHREPSFDEPVLPKFLATSTVEEPMGGGLLTGMHALQKMANKALACPCTSAELEGERCRQRFGRVYDVKRHVRKIHGLELSEGEVRLLLGDAEAGDSQVPI